MDSVLGKHEREEDGDLLEPAAKTQHINVPEQCPEPVLSKSGRRRARQKEAKIIAKQVTCSLPPGCDQTPQTFANGGLYHAHYVTCHTNVCSECKRNFPTAQILACHIAENHDPFTRIRLEKGEPVFGCFVAGCERLFKDHKKRRLHLIDKHGYPRDFVFSVVDAGIKKGALSLIKENNKGYNVWRSAKE